MHWLVVGCLILSTMLVACGGDTEDVTEADDLHARLTAIEATLASSWEVPTVNPPLTPTLPPTPTPDTAQTPGRTLSALDKPNSEPLRPTQRRRSRRRLRTSPLAGPNASYYSTVAWSPH